MGKTEVDNKKIEKKYNEPQIHHYSAWEYYDVLVWELEKALKEGDYQKYKDIERIIKNVQAD